MAAWKSTSILVAMAIAIGGGCGTTNNEEPKTPPPVPHDTGELDQPADDDSAQLDVICTPVTKVLIDGKDAGMSPITGKKMQPGSYDVTCADEETGSRTLTVVLAAHDSKSVSSNRIPKIQEQARDPKEIEKPKKK